MAARTNTAGEDCPLWFEGRPERQCKKSSRRGTVRCCGSAARCRIRRDGRAIGGRFIRLSFRSDETSGSASCGTSRRVGHIYFAGLGHPDGFGVRRDSPGHAASRPLCRSKRSALGQGTSGSVALGPAGNPQSAAGVGLPGLADAREPVSPAPRKPEPSADRSGRCRRMASALSSRPSRSYARFARTERERRSRAGFDQVPRFGVRSGASRDVRDAAVLA